MSETPSYFDWEKRFKDNKIKNHVKIKGVNSLGINKEVFKIYLSKWKKKNLLFVSREKTEINNLIKFILDRTTYTNESLQKTIKKLKNDKPNFSQKDAANFIIDKLNLK